MGLRPTWKNGPRLGHRKCPPESRKSLVGHPDATQFLQIFRKRVFQHVRLFSSSEKGTIAEAIGWGRTSEGLAQKTLSLWQLARKCKPWRRWRAASIRSRQSGNETWRAPMLLPRPVAQYCANVGGRNRPCCRVRVQSEGRLSGGGGYGVRMSSWDVFGKSFPLDDKAGGGQRQPRA
jgi:hypothetical protein